MVESSTISFSYRRHNLVNVKGKPVVNWIFFLIDALGSSLGALVALGLIIGDKKYCDNCRRYMKRKKLFNFPIGDTDTFIKLQEIDRLSPDEMKRFLSFRAARKEEQYCVYINWCDRCFEGYINMKCLMKDEKGRLAEYESSAKEIKVAPDVVKTLLGI